jgi:hypothetical protein
VISRCLGLAHVEHAKLKVIFRKRSDGERASTCGAPVPLGFGAPGSGLASARSDLTLPLRARRPPRNPPRLCPTSSTSASINTGCLASLRATLPSFLFITHFLPPTSSPPSSLAPPPTEGQTSVSLGPPPLGAPPSQPFSAGVHHAPRPQADLSG